MLASYASLALAFELVHGMDFEQHGFDDAIRLARSIASHGRTARADERDEAPDESPETPTDEPSPPRVQDPPPQPDSQGPYVVTDDVP